MVRLYSKLRASEKRVGQLLLQDEGRLTQHALLASRNRITVLERKLAKASDNAKSANHDLHAQIKELEAKANTAQLKLVKLQTEFDNYKQEFNASTRAPPTSIFSATNAKEQKQHAKELADLQKKHDAALKEAETNYRKMLKDEIQKYQEQAEKSAAKPGKKTAGAKQLEEKDKEIEKLTQKLQSVSSELSEALKKSDREMSPSKLGLDRSAQAKLAEVKKELSKKETQANKAEIELEKLRDQLETVKSTSETKLNTLKTKVKTLETQLEKREPKSKAVTAKKPSKVMAVSTPLNEPKTRFDQDMNDSLAAGKPSNISTFSTTPFLSRSTVFNAGPSAAGPSAAALDSPTTAPADKAKGAKPTAAAAKSGVFQLSPVRKNTKRTTQEEKKARKSFAFNKGTGQKISLFDNDSEDEGATATAQPSKPKPKAKKTTTKKLAPPPSSLLDGAAATEEEPKKKKKRKLNTTVKLDLYEDSGDEKDKNKDDDDAAAPGKPGSMFKRPKQTDANKLGNDPKLLDLPALDTAAANDASGAGGLFDRGISPLKARKKGVRPVFKV